MNGLDWEDIEEWRCCWLNGADGASVWGKPKDIVSAR